MTDVPEFSPARTRELLDAAERGSPEAITELIERHRERLLARIRLMLGPEVGRRAEDADFLQDVFLDLARNKHTMSFRDERDFVRLLSTVARNNVRDEGRKRRERRLADLTTRMFAGQDVPMSGPGPATQVAKDDHVNKLLEVLESLASDDRRVIELRNLEGLSFKEIGERMGRSDNATQLLHARALTRLSGMFRTGP